MNHPMRPKKVPVGRPKVSIPLDGKVPIKRLRIRRNTLRYCALLLLVEFETRARFRQLVEEILRRKALSEAKR